MDSGGNLYFSDAANGLIRKVTASTGLISTIAGGGSDTGDNIPATSARISEVEEIALDDASNVYLADGGNGRIRKVDAKTGIITAVAGGGTGCAEQTDSIGDGCAATSAPLYGPKGVALDSAGNIYIADTFNQRVRKVNAATGIITTVAGNGYTQSNSYGGYTGDNGPAAGAELNRYHQSYSANALLVCDRKRRGAEGGKARSIAQRFARSRPHSSPV